MIIFARKIQIIFVNHEQLILMRRKDNKLMETWVWDRSLSMNCRGFCLGQHRETINFTVSLPARTNRWFKGKKILLHQDVLAIFLWLSCFQENAACPWHWLAFSLDFSQPFSVCLKQTEPKVTKIQSALSRASGCRQLLSLQPFHWSLLFLETNKWSWGPGVPFYATIFSIQKLCRLRVI